MVVFAQAVSLSFVVNIYAAALRNGRSSGHTQDDSIAPALFHSNAGEVFGKCASFLLVKFLFISFSFCREPSALPTLTWRAKGSGQRDSPVLQQMFALFLLR